MKNLVFRYDIEGLAEGLGVSIEDISGLFASYFNEMQGEINDMRQFLECSDWDMLERVVHNVKGVSANLGITDVFEEAERFDVLLKSRETKNSAKYVDSLEQLINSAKEEIKDYFCQRGCAL
ncbi:MAG: Hpt domain-containing protein [Clostridia bacterium]|nr:Hpt domain-containing protein [Clostridia bacterium]